MCTVEGFRLAIFQSPMATLYSPGWGIITLTIFMKKNTFFSGKIRGRFLFHSEHFVRAQLNVPITVMLSDMFIWLYKRETNGQPKT